MALSSHGSTKLAVKYMINKRQATILATLLIVAAATIAAGAVYVMANQPLDQTDQSITFGEPPPDGMPGLETRPENQTDGPDGPQL